jgi:hypothetical protein
MVALDIINILEGQGEMHWRGQVFERVRYELKRIQRVTGGGMPVPGLHRIEGRVDLEGLGLDGDIEGASIALRLDDGRTMNLTITDAAGNVLAEGHGPSKCGCC